MKKEIWVNDLMQQHYCYFRTEPAGRNFHHGFAPQLTPKEMLALGVFGGRYMTDCTEEFPDDWFEDAKLCRLRHDPALNFFGVNASLPLAEWRRRGYLRACDPRGWFQWYCRYYSGRRCDDDLRQIRRHAMMVRHLAQLRFHCAGREWDCRRRQRQALLHWAYDTRRV